MKHRLVEKPHPEKKKHGNHYLKDAKKKESSNQLPTPLGLTTSKPICIFEPAIDHFRQRFERPKEKPHSCGQQKDIITVDRCKMALLDTLTCSF
jgi:NADPH-dependent glutamate synthase beta subunit-like oxidoreductase